LSAGMCCLFCTVANLACLLPKSRLF
jgi:hypothetical protein